MTRVIACGGLTIDWLQTANGRVGPSLGGNAAYAAAGAWLAGADAEIVAVIGDDYPADLLEQLSRVGIGISGVRTSPGPSFRVLMDESGPRRTISYLPESGHNDRLDPLPSQLPELRAADGVHICAIPTSSQRAMLEAAADLVDVVTLDSVVIPDEIEPSTAELLDLARRASVFMPSRDEVEHHWSDDVEEALWRLRDIGCDRVVIKLGSDGSIGRDGTETIRVPAAEASAIDPTGAGDAFCGAACARLAMGDPLRTAMTWGAAAASVIIQGHGAAAALTSAGQASAADRADRLTSVTARGSVA
ncbi:MAG: carbohydrate kinase family protein [Candidatus Limnocylindria bacterium]